MLTFRFLLIISILLLAPSLYSASSSNNLPDDVRYMIEDMYGLDQKKWPKKIYSEDFNGDGFPDWISVSPECQSQDQCEVDLFICTGTVDSICNKFCYAGSGSLETFRKQVNNLKCDSTC